MLEMTEERLRELRAKTIRFREYYVDTKTFGFSETLALGAACGVYGMQVVEALEEILEELENREDDLK